MTHVTCRLTAKNRDQLRNPRLCNWVWATFIFFCLLSGLTPQTLTISTEHTWLLFQVLPLLFHFFLFQCTRSSWRSQFWSAQKYTLWYHMVSYKKRDIHKYQNLIQDEQLSNIFFCKSICKFLNNHKLHKSNILKTTRNKYNYHVFSSPILISSRQITTPIQPIKKWCSVAQTKYGFH